MRTEVDNKEQNGYQVTFLYNSHDVDFVAALLKQRFAFHTKMV